jgi:D-alanyl-D-alanine carboxypeptidase
MSAARGSASRPVSTGAIRWSIYLTLGVAVAALMLRMAARTLALAQNAPPLPTDITPPTATVFVAATLAPPTDTPTPTNTPVPFTPTATPTETPLPAATLTAIYIEHCSSYSFVPEDLLTHVDRETALDRDFVPDDLEIVPLAPANMGFRQIPLRQPVIQPLLDMIEAMNLAGLQIQVVSGYRSYSEQQLAYEKVLDEYPDRAPEISAVPGHSEHQLGTTVDFSTPYMEDLYGDEFHINFFQTPEGQWLNRQAAYYGFTMSYQTWAVEQTGYAWEPWHYRYVGGLLAQELLRRNITLTEYLQECRPQ